jgi:tyrosine-protein phosphatase SIW14
MTYKSCTLTVLLMVNFGWPLLAASEVPGIHNFHKVDDKVYRGAQPSEAGFRYLAEIGVKTIVDLREADSRGRAEEKLVTAEGLKYISVPMTGLTPPTDAQIRSILNVLTDPSMGPVFVHCMRGADRTGAVIASYRIEHDRWDNARALKEAMDDGMSFFQYPRQHFIRDFHGQSATTMEASADTKLSPQQNPVPAVAVSQ